MGIHNLVPHPAALPRAVEGVRVQLAATPSSPGELWLEFGVRSPKPILISAERGPIRAHELWRTTCFELFVRPRDSERYFEFNLSPSLAWAAYEFSAYRSGMRDAEARDPEIVTSSPGGHFVLAAESLVLPCSTPLLLGLSAVIEEGDGTKSYWALRHPPGDRPDFHHPDCFALELPSASGS